MDAAPSDSDDEGSLSATYCCNCTARLFMGTTCLVRAPAALAQKQFQGVKPFLRVLRCKEF